VVHGHVLGDPALLHAVQPDGHPVLQRSAGRRRQEVVATHVEVALVEQVTVGTKDKPTATPSADGLNWAALAKCESGGNPRAVNPAGYYGLYQFSLSTWRSVGGSGNPVDASPDEQTARAQTLYARSGAGQWGCGSHLFD
jgi:hypothetical protein